MRIKEKLLGWGLGGPFIRGRDKLELLYAAFKKPETLGTIANDQLAALLVTRICKSGKVFVDVGAHIGSVTAEVIHHNPSVHVEAIEAIPAKVESLSSRFPNVKFHCCAVGETEQNVQFFVNTQRSGYSSLGKQANVDQSMVVELLVPMRRLDSLIQGDEVDVIKVDVEGAELGALKGGVSLIERCRPLIMFESAPGDPNGLGVTKDELWDFLRSINYVVVVPNRLAHNDEGLSKEGFSESHLYPRRTTNYFAVPCERRVEFRDRARTIIIGLR